MKTQAPLAIVIDLHDQEHISIGLTNVNGKIVKRSHICPVLTYPHLSGVLEKSIRDLMVSAEPGVTLYGIGICIRKVRLYSTHPKNNLIDSMADHLSRRFNLPVYTIDSVHAMTFAELHFGSAVGMKNFIEINLNATVDSSVVINGHVLDEESGSGNGLGHTIIMGKGRKHWNTGLRGTLESYCSGQGMVMTALDILKRKINVDSILHRYKPEEINADIICKCAEDGDVLAGSVLEATGKTPGQALANFVTIFAPEAIILSGLIAKAGDRLIDPARERMERYLLPGFKRKVKLNISKFNHSDAVLLGTAAFVGMQCVNLTAQHVNKDVLN